MSELLAKQLWVDHDPIRRTLRIDHTPHEVIGVVAGYKHSPFSHPTPRLYLPIAQHGPPLIKVQVVVRAITSPGALVQTIRREISGLDPAHVVSGTATLDEILAIGGMEILALTYAMAPLIGTALFLTAAGIFGVLAFSITRRSKELALRLAIGATGRDVVVHVTAQSLRLVAVGSAIGVAATFALTRLVRASGGGGSVFDTPSWPAFVVPILIVGAVGGLAVWVPSRRALRIDPAAILRTE